MRDVFNIIHEFKEHGVGINRFLRILIHPMLLVKFVTMFGLIGSIERSDWPVMSRCR